MSIGGATFDLFVRTDQKFMKEDGGGKTLNLPIGAKVRVLDVIETCGGGASNTAVGLSRLQCDAAFCGVVGSDQWGEKLLKNLQSEHVDTRWATVVDGETSSFSIILSVSSGERIILYEPGTNEHLHDVTFDREEIRHRNWIFLNHLHKDSIAIQDDLSHALGQAAGSVGLTWNPGGAQVEQGCSAPAHLQLLGHTSLLLLNKEEALAFTKKENVEEATKKLLDTGARIVCITDGGNGATATDKNGSWYCPSKGEDVVDTTGAGDAFGIGCTWALVNGFDLPTMLQAGTINATSVLSQMGAQAGLLTDIEMRTRLQSRPPDVSARKHS